MISIVEAISDLLFVRDTVVVPGLGAFVKKPIPAKVNPVANYFAMPSCQIEFDSNLREDNDLIISYVSERNNISMDESRRMLSLFVSDCFNRIKEGKEMVLKNIGALSYSTIGEIVFEPDNVLNYNADAFGMSDFSLEPVLRHKTKEEIKVEIAKQQKDKNTPVTVDEEAVHEEDSDWKRHNGWLWIVSCAVLLAALGYTLQHFGLLGLGQAEISTPRSVAQEQKTYSLPTYNKQWEWIEPVHEGIRIIAGCYDQEGKAARLASTLRKKGFSGAFYEQINKKWYVSFGCYGTEEEATDALRDIRANTEYKAWIMK